MHKYDIDHERTRSFFFRVVIFVIVALVFFVLGSLFSIGILSVANGVSAGDLITGNIDLQQQEQVQQQEEQQVPQTQEESEPVLEEQELEPDRDFPELQEKIESEIMSLEGFDNAISRVVEEVTPSVVNIRVLVVQEDMFGNQMEGEGVGSGVIYTEDGYVITNAHVVESASDVVVVLSDGKEYPATIVGSDLNTDIAVIKIDQVSLDAAEFTSIEDVRVGELAIALGSPFGLQQTVTLGVVSAKGREIAVSTDTLPMVDLIQTDATINPGNSGGPLVNTAGQVIGINNMIVSPSGVSAGIGFAIPSDTAVNIAQQIIKFGRARIPYLGIEMGENDTDIPGVFLVSVIDGYPAQEAGIQSGDIIVEYDGKQVSTPYQLLTQILRSNVGDEITLKIYRDGSYLTKDVALAESPMTQQQ